MVAAADQPATLSPEELNLLAELCNPDTEIDFARPDIAQVLQRPEAQSHLETLTNLHDIRFTASLQQASLRAIKTLESIIEKSDDLVEHRRAASSILRTIRSAKRNTSRRDHNPCHPTP